MLLLRLCRLYSTAPARRLSVGVKQLIQAPWSNPEPVPAPKNLQRVFESIAKDAKTLKLHDRVWQTVATATIATLNSPEGLARIYSPTSSESPNGINPDFVREVVLRCISFNGIPKTINTLAALPPLEAQAKNDLIKDRPPMPESGWTLWQSIYGIHADNLAIKLGSYHPDLPKIILHHHYGALLSGSSQLPFSGPGEDLRPMIGRMLTSVIACSCLRAQQGAHMQVTSHVHGLLNAYGSNETTEELTEMDPKRVFSKDMGIMILLLWVDRIVDIYKPGQAESIIKIKGIGEIKPNSSIEKILESETVP